MFFAYIAPHYLSSVLRSLRLNLNRKDVAYAKEIPAKLRHGVVIDMFLDIEKGSICYTLL